MQRWVVIGVVAVVFVVGGVGSSGAPAAQGNATPDGGNATLAERWTTAPDEPLESNHHTPAGTYFDGEGYVAVPINSRQGTVCVLETLDGTGAERWRDSLPQDECTVHAVSDPAIADYDRDGQPEVLAATSEQVFVAYNLSTGEPELRHNLTSYGYSKPIVANLTPAPGPETVVVDLLGGVFVLRPDGTEAWTRQVEDARVRQPSVRDFDADGRPELAVGQLSGAVVVFDHEGGVEWRTNFSDATSVRWMTTGQFDRDDAVEIAVATFNGHVVALDGGNGSVEWNRDLGGVGTLGGAGAVSAAGGAPLSALHEVRGAAVRAADDGDGDGQVEVYPVARDGTLSSLDASDGTVEWTTNLTDDSVVVAPPPSMGDLDGDDEPELVAVTATGRVAVLDPATGDVLASHERDGTIRTFPRLADVDGDDRPEVLVIYGDGTVVALSYSE